MKLSVYVTSVALVDVELSDTKGASTVVGAVKLIASLTGVGSELVDTLTFPEPVVEVLLTPYTVTVTRLLPPIAETLLLVVIVTLLFVVDPPTIDSVGVSQ
jgi:hypothetical protein